MRTPPTRIILNLMVKNEGKIIQRCISHALPYVDAVCILDTGSTDDTIQQCHDLAIEKPYQIHSEPFVNFGFNRTISFQNTQAMCTELGWSLEDTYALAIDADMVIVGTPAFHSFPLKLPGYHLIQENGPLSYYNVRLLKCSEPWTCIGSTHEYWSGNDCEKIPKHILYINDKNDGGCKSDKFERDVRLLTADIKADPTNARSHFYLAQSFRDLGMYNESIKSYLDRIELGGWDEEVWYSYYQVGKCYELLDNAEMTELWMNRAYELRKWRAEPLYALTRYFRTRSQHYKAYHYYMIGKSIPYPSHDLLFIERPVYNGLFAYEDTILAYHVHKRSKLDLLESIISYINLKVPYYVQNVLDNLRYYIVTLDGVHTPELPLIPTIDKWHVTSFQHEHTLYGWHVDPSTNKHIQILKVDPIATDTIIHPVSDMSIVDVRVFSSIYTCTKTNIVEYESKRIQLPITPMPFTTKNTLNMVVGWSPFTIATLSNTSAVVYPTPPIFNLFESTQIPACQTENGLYFMVRMLDNHVIVRVDMITFEPLEYSLPFQTCLSESCIGLGVDEDTFTLFTMNEHTSNTCVIQRKDMRFVSVHTHNKYMH